MTAKALLSNLHLFALGLVAWVGAVLVAHDALRFSSIRERIDLQLAKSSYVEQHPTHDVRKAFDLDQSYFVSAIAFGLYRDSIEDTKWPPFASKFLAVQMWSIQLSFWYSRSKLETYHIHTGCYDDRYGLGGCDDLSERLFGKSLNDISAAQLSCIRAFHRTGRKDACPEIAALIEHHRR